MKQANHKAELGTQLLFGEKAEVLEEKQLWVKIVTQNSNYEGWMLKAQLKEITQKEFKQKNQYLSATYSLLTLVNDNEIIIPYGAALNIHAAAHVAEKLDLTTIEKSSDVLLQIAHLFMNAPYMWGGRTHLGIDCSGLVQMVFMHFGYWVKHQAEDQFSKGKIVKQLKEARSGDVLFFSTNKKINHVGIYLGQHKIIHANEGSGGVSIDWIDDKGIRKEATKKYTHQLHGIKRYLNFSSAR